MEQTDNTKTLQNALEKIAELQADNSRHLQRIVQLESEIKAQELPAEWSNDWPWYVMTMWLCVRKHDSSIPSDMLDYMRDQLIKKNERFQQ